MSEQKSTPTVKRIPVGTRVRWQTEPGYGRMWDGIVIKFEPALLQYVVEVDKTATGRPVKTVRQMRPWASRLESQNPDALRSV